MPISAAVPLPLLRKRKQLADDDDGGSAKSASIISGWLRGVAESSEAGSHHGGAGDAEGEKARENEDVGRGGDEEEEKLGDDGSEAQRPRTRSAASTTAGQENGEGEEAKTDGQAVAGKGDEEDAKMAE